MIKKLSKISLSAILSLGLVMSGCSKADGPLTSKEAVEELSAYLSKIKVTNVEPVMDINSSDDEVSQLADISEYPLVVDGGNAEIVIEIATSTEKSTAKSGSNPYDDLYIYAAEQFNSSDFEVNDKSVGISIRKITSGDVLTYVSEAGYKPEAYSPSNTLWAEMIESMGYSVELIEEKTAGNTAGILMKKSVYDKYNKSHGDVTIGGVIDAAMADELSFAYVNPYTSSTGLNCFTQMLKMFDPSNPLSDTARQNALAYQDTAPAVAFTTAEMRKSAQNGLVDVMAMERQAY
ncbi:MAG: substrate-binding domain-containing protein, partial [Oscillospiraceae bacterium]|nr:substrate-binding domain-containing protein [Oscillospiraceae bacterium]